MDVDNFKQTFVNYCRSELKQLYKECEIDGKFQVSLFNKNLVDVWLSAQINGLNEYEFSSVIEDVICSDLEQVILPYQYGQVA